MEHTGVSDSQMAALREIALQGSIRAAESFGRFSSNVLTVSGAEARVIPVEEIPFIQGNPEEVVAGVHFSIGGDLSGYLLTFFRWYDASLLLESLMGQRPQGIDELDEVEISALGESGNIIASSFLCALEALCGLVALPSPPDVAIDMCGAILASAALPVVEAGGIVLFIEAEIRPTGERQSRAASCRLLFLPAPEAWSRMHQAFMGASH